MLAANASNMRQKLPGSTLIAPSTFCQTSPFTASAIAAARRADSGSNAPIVAPSALYSMYAVR
jgi:hypothetical protein